MFDTHFNVSFHRFFDEDLAFMPPRFFTQRHTALTLVEILVSLTVMAFLSLLIGVVIRAMEDMRATGANKVVQTSVYQIQQANTQFVSEGGWINVDTHITQIMNQLDATEVIDTETDPAVNINGFTPTTALTCGDAFTCYRLNSGGIVAVRSLVAGDLVGANGYFAAPVAQGNIPPATEVNRHTTLLVLIDPDGVFRANDPSSASAHFTFDDLARFTPRPTGVSTIAGVTATQAPYLNLQQ
jgi:competence protein ComGC